MQNLEDRRSRGRMKKEQTWYVSHACEMQQTYWSKSKTIKSANIMTVIGVSNPTFGKDTGRNVYGNVFIS